MTDPEPNYQFPLGCPRHLTESLMQIAKDVAWVMGKEAAQNGTFLTSEVMEIMVINACAAMQCATHHALHNSAELLANSQVQEWLAKNPKRP